MGVAIVGAEQRGATFAFAVCADYGGAVEALVVDEVSVPFAAAACAHAAAAHAVYAFPAEPPDGRSAAEWAAACAREAYLLAQQTQVAQPAASLVALLGLG
jgi:hypothetical protein